MPERIEVDGRTYVHVKTYKHDFFAATGRYQGEARQVILKLSRHTAFLGIPLQLVGRCLSRHEAIRLRSVHDLEGVPAFVGMYGATGMVHEFVPGHELQKGEMVADDFFDRLARLIQQMHLRDFAYVDLEKRENILVGDDGRPYLIDFQISWPWPLGPVTGWAPGRWMMRRLQQADWYHLQKHRRRFRPDQLSPDERASAGRRPWGIRLHNQLTHPLRRVRRWLLSFFDPHHGESERGRVPENSNSG